MPIDYSKWDHIGSDSDEEEPKRPNVTAFETPQSITIPGKESNEGKILKAPHAERSTSGPSHEGLSRPRNGAVFDEYAWDQDRSQVTFWFKLPRGAVISARRPEREVKLLTAEPPSRSEGDYAVPEAIVASDFNESKDDGDQGLFPVAWGMQLKWPYSETEGETDQLRSLWQKVNDQIQTSELWFPYPVMLGESTWSWTLESTCPYMSDNDTRFVKIELTKKRSQSLHNINIMWNRGLRSEAKRITITRSPAEQARHDAFLQAWNEAHAEFKDKVKTMEPTMID